MVGALLAQRGFPLALGPRDRYTQQNPAFPARIEKPRHSPARRAPVRRFATIALSLALLLGLSAAGRLLAQDEKKDTPKTDATAPKAADKKDESKKDDTKKDESKKDAPKAEVA